MVVIDDFLAPILTFLRAKDAQQLQAWLQVEPPLPDSYTQLAQELKASYRDSKVLERRITKLLPEIGDVNANEGDVWPGFLAFIQEYMEFWRDVDFSNLKMTHSQLSSVAKYVHDRSIQNCFRGPQLMPTAPVLQQCPMQLMASQCFLVRYHCRLHWLSLPSHSARAPT